jgi:hypothetical protein
VISEVVTVTGRLEGEAQRVVRGGRAIIRRPVKGRGVPGVSASGEGGERDAEEDLVRDCYLGLGTRRKSRESQGGCRHGQDEGAGFHDEELEFGRVLVSVTKAHVGENMALRGAAERTFYTDFQDISASIYNTLEFHR